ncbi:MAG: hypothetical protein ABIS14_15225 [Sphingomonas sp.]
MMIDAYKVSVGAAGTRPQAAPTGSNRFAMDLPDSPAIQPSSDAAKLADAFAGFMTEARKTPQQRCKDEVMKEWHITQDTLDAMPPAQSRALMERIDSEVARRMGMADPSKSGTDQTGAVTNITTVEALGGRSIGAGSQT